MNVEIELQKVFRIKYLKRRTKQNYSTVSEKLIEDNTQSA